VAYVAPFLYNLIMNKITTEKIPILSWANELEGGALTQAKNLANLPFAKKHIALMPDCHQGYGMPIGGVLATENVIIPNAVGVDIGCGMCAVKTSLKEIDTETLKKIMGEIRKVIPLGFNKHKQEQDENLMPEDNYWLDTATVVHKEFDNALKSIGTLGGGNHFIEVQKGNDDYIWIMIHSGSRNLGKQVADYYNKLAIQLNEKWHSVVPKEWELAFLPVDSQEGQGYIKEMNYCIDFALANRKLMIDRIKEVMEGLGEVGFNTIINIAHNYASLENHLGKNLWIHRKGATLATEDTIGIIPGSQGTSSYIVKGKGNPASFNSCSHGAGRKMGRKQAQKELNYEEEIKKMGNVIHGMRSVKDLDEAPGSYKDISEVMKNQEDLVNILVELKPLAVIKG
jgi:tRNA-splicing ligase RtcB (3'-phosphate/5'-hydroxy nucleic acid ligase)